MSKSEKPEDGQPTVQPTFEGLSAPVEGQPGQRVQVQIDDSKAMANYGNFCRVTGTPEELIIDFGLNPQPVGLPTQPIIITQRIITNFYTAKRMLHALQLTIPTSRGHLWRPGDRRAEARSSRRDGSTVSVK